MIDYIFAVTDLINFRATLSTMVSDLVIDSKVVLPTTMINYKENQSVAMVRTTQDNLEEIQSLADVVLCGHGVNIKTESDVTWINKDLYYEIYDISPITTTDEYGESTYTPSKLHCVFS